MKIDVDYLLSAASIPPDNGHTYFVAFTNGHRTLNVGDPVMVRELTRTRENIFVRTSDSTVHELQGEYGYVLVVLSNGILT